MGSIHAQVVEQADRIFGHVEQIVRMLFKIDTGRPSTIAMVVANHIESRLSESFAKRSGPQNTLAKPSHHQQESGIALLPKSLIPELYPIGFSHLCMRSHCKTETQTQFPNH